MAQQPTTSSSSSTQELRRGKWTLEEQRFVERVIRDFNDGTLQAEPGTTLRNFLSEKLNCERVVLLGIEETASAGDPMRITKKFTGQSSIGKRVFHPCDDEAAVERSRREIAALESAWRVKLDSQQRETSSSSAPRSSSKSAAQASEEDDCRKKRLDAEAASQLETWLERASRILDPNPGRTVMVEEVDAVVADGEALRSQLVRDEEYAQKSPKRPKFNVKDEEATTLLFDFIRSARKEKSPRPDRTDDDDDDDDDGDQEDRQDAADENEE